MVVLVAVALVVVIGVAAGVTVAANSQAQLENSIKIENLMAHLKVSLYTCVYLFHALSVHVYMFSKYLQCTRKAPITAPAI